MTAIVIVGFLEQAIGIGIAARTDDVVDATAVLVPAVPVERVLGDRRQRP